MKAGNKDFDEKTIACLGRYYGTECREVLELARRDRSLSDPVNQDGEIAAQAIYAIREEMALTLKDILMRRTGIGTLGDPGDGTISMIADMAAKELNWDDARKTKEINEVKKLFKMPN